MTSGRWFVPLVVTLATSPAARIAARSAAKSGSSGRLAPAQRDLKHAPGRQPFDDPAADLGARPGFAPGAAPGVAVDATEVAAIRHRPVRDDRGPQARNGLGRRALAPGIGGQVGRIVGHAADDAPALQGAKRTPPVRADAPDGLGRAGAPAGRAASAPGPVRRPRRSPRRPARQGRPDRGERPTLPTTRGGDGRPGVAGTERTSSRRSLIRAPVG